MKLLLLRASALLTLIAMGIAVQTVVAAPILLNSTTQCSAGNAANGIAIGDVTGNAGGATDCWGAFTGNDPGPSGDGFQIGADVFNFVAKQNTPGALEGADIGLIVNPGGGALTGTWAVDSGALGGDDFLVILKAANSPGFGAWLFSGTDAASFSGSWAVAWGQNLSHLSIYKGPTGTVMVPEPSVLGLMAIGLIAIGLGRRRRK